MEVDDGDALGQSLVDDWGPFVSFADADGEEVILSAREPRGSQRTSRLRSVAAGAECPAKRPKPALSRTRSAGL